MPGRGCSTTATAAPYARSWTPTPSRPAWSRRGWSSRGWTRGGSAARCGASGPGSTACASPARTSFRCTAPGTPCAASPTGPVGTAAAARRSWGVPSWSCRCGTSCPSHWSPPREVRAEQPLMVLAGAPAVAPDPLVRPVRMDELDRYLPAAVAMFTEEVGVDPRAGDGGVGYRARVAELVHAGRAFARFDGDQVVFKAEIGALSRQVGQIQGVWVHPACRGRGLGTVGTAAVDRPAGGHGPGVEPVRQRLQHGGEAGVRADRFPAGRRASPPCCSETYPFGYRDTSGRGALARSCRCRSAYSRRPCSAHSPSSCSC